MKEKFEAVWAGFRKNIYYDHILTFIFVTYIKLAGSVGRHIAMALRSSESQLKGEAALAWIVFPVVVALPTGLVAVVLRVRLYASHPNI